MKLIAADNPSYPPDVAKALEKAANNRPQLERVIAHYAHTGVRMDDSTGDSLKLQAAYYLIGNMEGHSYQIFALYDSSKNIIEFKPLDYPKYDSLTVAFTAMEAKHGPLDFDKLRNIPDLDTITADFLITQIDYAFRAWREKPWAKGLSFSDFCEYILPYRGSNEPLENWREYFWQKYSGIETTMTNPSDPIEAAKIINNDVKKWFTFDPRYYYHPTDEGLSEMLNEHLGRCEDMTNAAIYAMRANGLAVTSDYTPYWGNSGNNHAWNSIVTPDGKVTPFMGAEANPGEYHLWNKLAKVYRKMYSQQKDNLIFLERKQEKVPAWLAGKSYIDVTKAYVDVCDVTVKFEKPIPDSVDIAYLCVFNDGDWQAIHWGKIKDGQALFTDMGRDIAYLPALFMNGKIVPFGSPFILGTDCSMKLLKSDGNKTIKTKLFSTTQRKQEISTDGITKTFLTAGKQYELFYWNDGWLSLGKKTAAKKPLTFKKVPEGSLFWLVEDGSDHEERIFTIENGQQIWW